ncbi:MAG: lysophospholipid acyltransferase family protein [Prevotellaceae bacterium]|jgi:KDO2-lipid IV(A) lauroyltransferase|nr:lysophospholipid acyltransferase family protein [Prevotellaceae bacterium]
MTAKQRRKKIRRAIKYPILIFFIKLLVATMRVFPRRWVELFFAFFGWLAFLLVRGERKRTFRSLQIAFGQTKKEKEIYNIARQVFINQALNFADYVHAVKWKTRKQFSRMINIEGEKHLREAYQQGKGVICLVLHTGSWELAAIMPPVMGYETSAISQVMPNAGINKIIVEARESRGMKNISRGKSYPKLLDALHRGECLIIMVDQDTKVPGVFVDFFGRKAYTPVGAARLALDTGAPVIPMYMTRTKDNRHRFRILPEIPTVNTGNLEHDLYENTCLYTQFAEDAIRPDPAQWVWMHPRWKTTPEDVARHEAKKAAQKL